MITSPDPHAREMAGALRDTLLPKRISGELRVKSKAHEAKSEAIA